MQKFLLTIISLVSIFSLASQTGTVSGRIIDSELKEEVPMANIFVKGTQNGVTADISGSYAFELKEGDYTLVCSFVGYENDEKEVTVVAGKAIELNFELLDASLKIGVAEVVARKIKGTENSIDAMKGKSGLILDGVSASQAKKLGTSNVADMTSKASGVSVDGGKYVYVRGLSDRYSLTTLNGGEIPGLDPNRNSVQLDLFPTNLVDNVTIIKTFVPSKPGNFTGGLVDIITKDFPDSLQYNVSLSLGYNSNASLNSSFLSYAGSPTDFLGFDNGTRALPNEVASSEVENVLLGNQTVLQNQTRSFSNIWVPSTKMANPNHKFSFSFGNRKKLKGDKILGYNLSTTYSRNYRFYSEGLTGRYKLVGDVRNTEVLNLESIYSDSRGDENVLLGALANISIKYKKGHQIGLTLIRNQNGISSARVQTGRVPGIDNTFLKKQFSIRYLERSLNTAQLKGTHILNEESGVRVNWIASAAYAAQDTPDLRVLEYLIKNPEQNSGYDLYDADINVPSRFFRKMMEWNFDTKVDLTIPLNLKNESNIQVGLSNVIKDRDFEEKLYEFYSNGVSFTGDVESFFNPENMNTSDEDFIYVEDRTDTKNSYHAAQNVMAAYAMTDYMFSDSWRLIAGARIESAFIQSTSLKFYEANTETERNKYRGELNNVDVLPSINIKRVLDPETNLRFAYNRTLARPSFREISAFATFDFENQLVNLGNPNLERTLIDNLDLRYEFFPNIGELFSVSTFYKRFHNSIELVVNPEAANVELTWENQDIATLYGIEFDFKKSLNFIKALENYKISTNVTLVESKTKISKDELIQIQETNPFHSSTRRMFGQAPYIINGVLSYDKKETGWGGNISYNVSGEKLVLVVIGGTPNVMEQPRHNLGLSINKTFSNKVSVTLRGSNLLDARTARTYTFKGQEYDFQSFQLGRTLSASFSYTF